MTYFKKAHFIYDDNSESLIKTIESNRYGVEIHSMYIDDFIDNIAAIGDDINHVVVSINEENIPYFLAIAYQCNLSVGIVPLPHQKEQHKNLYCSNSVEENIDIALRDDCKSIDLIQIDNKLMYTHGVIGTVPLLGKKLMKTRGSFFKTFLYGIKKFFSLELQKFEITTQNNRKVTTAGTAIVVLNNTKSSLISKIFNFKQSMCDGEITIVIVSPFSIFEYIKLLFSFFTGSSNKVLPESIGYMKSKSFEIKASKSKRINFDNGESMPLPLKCKVIKDAIKINASEEFWEKNKRLNPAKETIKITNLPDATEANKYMSKHIPLFRFASEDRFKELFSILRIDAKINATYLTLMVLSTLLATVGLFADSTAVIIGAMLVAPLMTPIVAFAMGLLRGESSIIKDSLIKIFVGILLAILASTILTYMLPYSHVTTEMKSRINPTLLDLAIAILSGIAAAYSKSFKEIINNLTGVAIAVALVPPLAVAGIGLGYGEFAIFFGAFLLFFTNLVGIVLASVITFQILGFSNALKSKKSVAFIFSLLLVVSYPLYISYDKMVQRYQISSMLKQHRFIVNNKYIIVNDAEVFFKDGTKVLILNLLVRESLNRDDFRKLKSDIQRLFNTKLFIETRVEYIL
jgi:uncharacterized hydrophobic protein (TIGR00271 family)